MNTEGQHIMKNEQNSFENTFRYFVMEHTF